MKVVNPSYPRGNKFYLIYEAYHDICRKAFSLKTYQAAEHITLNTQPGNAYLGPGRTKNWVDALSLKSNTEFPRFEVHSNLAFFAIHEGINSHIEHKKCNYQSIERIRDLGNMPWKKDMQIQWDDIRKGFIVFDVPYEGELEKVPKQGISKAITETLKDIIAETGMFDLLGEAVYTGYAYSDSVQGDKAFKESFEALLNGTFTPEQATSIALYSKAYRTEFCNTEYTRIQKLKAPGSNKRIDYKYYKLVRNNNTKPTISTVTRTNLMYKYGGYKLPDNYKEWFDG